MAAEMVPAKGFVPAGREYLHGTFVFAGALFPTGNIKNGHLMIIETTKGGKPPTRTSSRAPMFVAVAVAFVGALAILVVDHGPWNRPQVQTAEVANYKTTGEAARAVGASVTPSAPKPELEPVAPGPKPAQPANPTPQ